MHETDPLGLTTEMARELGGLHEADVRREAAYRFAQALGGPLTALSSCLADTVRLPELRPTFEIARLLHQTAVIALGVSMDVPIDVGLSDVAGQTLRHLEAVMSKHGEHPGIDTAPEAMEVTAKLAECRETLLAFIADQRGKEAYTSTAEYFS